MKSEFITFIWFATFENQSQLKNYVDWTYSDNEDEPKCRFAEDIGLEYFSSDFLECAYVPTGSNLLDQVEYLSFAENFKTQLFTNIDSLNHTDKNSIILLSGKKDVYGDINENLFDFAPMTSNKKYLQFVGCFKYKAD